MKTRVAFISVILDSPDKSLEVNNLISQHSEYIVGRMGIPYKKRGISIIGIVIDAPQDAISNLSGKLGRLDGVSAKTTYSNFCYEDDENV